MQQGWSDATAAADVDDNHRRSADDDNHRRSADDDNPRRSADDDNHRTRLHGMHRWHERALHEYKRKHMQCV